MASLGDAISNQTLGSWFGQGFTVSAHLREFLREIGGGGCTLPILPTAGSGISPSWPTSMECRLRSLSMLSG